MHPLALKDPPRIDRRERYAKMEPAERALWNAAIELEKLGTDYRIKEAVRLLDEARAVAADFADKVERPDL